MNLKTPLLAALTFCWLALACNPEPADRDNDPGNPAAEGFDLAHSDPAAVELADSVMAAMGGYRNWEATRFISWSFAKRNLVWDKPGGRVRIESPADSTIYLLNLNTMKGRVKIGGAELKIADSLAVMLEKARRIWINDSYWLVMPFKLKDSGVTLKYLGEDTTLTGIKSNVLELTFKDVGVTPENRYQVYVDLKDNLVKQWAFFREASQDSASWILPFDNYRKTGRVLLSADRTGGRGPSNVRVDDKLPDSVFSDF